MSLPQRFIDRVKSMRDGECWIWIGAHTPDGYGVTSRNGKKIVAHRFAYEELIGPIPDGSELDHYRCFEHACVNPLHLRPKTHKGNQENRKGANSNSKSGVRGVSWDSRKNKWRVTVGHHQKSFFGGYFTQIEEAAAAAKLLRSKLYSTPE